MRSDTEKKFHFIISRHTLYHQSNPVSRVSPTVAQPAIRFAASLDAVALAIGDVEQPPPTLLALTVAGSNEEAKEDSVVGRMVVKLWAETVPVPARYFEKPFRQGKSLSIRS